MARRKVQKDFTASILAGSEELFDFFCQPCSSEKHVEAVGYCQDCSEYLCTACINYHRKIAALKHHKVLDKSAMPKTKLPSKVQTTDVLTEKCSKHADKVLEYFCKPHGQICCSVCITLDHTSCSNKSYIPDVSGGIAKSQEYRKLKADLDKLVGEIKIRQEKIIEDNKNNEKHNAKTLADIKAFRKEINDLLDKIEEDTKQKLNKLHQENVSILRSTSEKWQSLLLEMKSMAVNVETTANSGKHNQLFVQVQISRHRIADVEKQFSTRFKVIQYNFDQDKKMLQMKSTLSAIWSLSVRQDETPTKTHYVREVNAEADGDTSHCAINGIAVLDNGRIAATDCHNNALKLFDMNKLITSRPLSTPPCDICQIKPNQVAVALGKEEKIEVITVTDTLSTSRIIKTPNAGIAGLCYNGSHFITVCQLTGSVKIIDMSGKTLNTFSTGSNGEQLFTTPARIALSRDKDVVYITDMDANTVTSMTLSGRVISVYSHEELVCPLGVTVGKDGSVYVCSLGTHTVHQLTSTGDLTRIILGRAQGLTEVPGVIGYSEEEGWLCISNDSQDPEYRNYIRLYQLR